MPGKLGGSLEVLGKVFLRILKWIFIISFVGGLAAGVTLFLSAKYLEEKYDVLSNLVLKLPEVQGLRKLKPKQASVLYDRNGKTIGCYAKEFRFIIPPDEIPSQIEKAVLASEDKNFYRHHGLDWGGILRALATDLAHGKIISGGSTITQQVAKLMFLTPERTPERKLKEAVLALKLERYFTKKEIFWFYANMVYLGHGRYGFEAAARFYFKKSAEDLSLSEAAMLAGLISSPEHNSPHQNPRLAEERRRRVLRLMREENLITETDYQTALADLPEVAPWSDCKNLAPYFAEEVRKEFGDKFPLFTGGLKIFTTLDSDLQKETALASREPLADYRQRHPENSAELRFGVVALDLATGAVLAMQGGEDFAEIKYDAVTQASRQPGSAFKPFTYAAALESGWNKFLLDQPVTISMGGGKFKIVHNYPYEGIPRYRGWISPEVAIAESRNAATVYLAKQIGIARVLEMAHRLGIKSKLKPYPTTSIGASEVTLLELTAALSAMVNGGYKITPYMVSEIYDGDGKLLYSREPQIEKVLSDDVAEKMKFLLEGVVNLPHGTAHSLRRFFKEGELAGKTGTATNENGDATDNWFIGFAPGYAVGSWMGLDLKKPLGSKETGGRNALPVFRNIVKDLELVGPESKFEPIFPVGNLDVYPSENQKEDQMKNQDAPED